MERTRKSLFSLLGFMLSSPAWAASLSIFCGAPPMRPCADVISQYTPMVKDQIQLNIDAFYTGKAYFPLAATSADRFDPTAKIETQTCNQAQGETTTNKVPASCGSPCQFTCTAPPPPNPLPSPSPSPSPTPGSSSLAENVTCRIINPSACDAEKSYLRGLFIQMVQDQRDKVFTEIQTRNSFDVSDRCNAPTPLASDIATLFENTNGKWATYWGSVPGRAPPNCTDSAGGPRIAACSLDGARGNLENFAFQVAVCEILARSEMQWQSQNPLPLLNQIVANTVASQLGTGTGQCLPGNSGCINTAYAKVIAKEMSNPTLPPPPASFVLTPSPALACPAGSPGPVGWEVLICSSYPPTPFTIGELGASIKAGKSLVTVPNLLDQATQMISNTPTTGTGP